MKKIETFGRIGLFNLHNKEKKEFVVLKTKKNKPNETQNTFFVNCYNDNPDFFLQTK